MRKRFRRRAIWEWAKSGALVVGDPGAPGPGYGVQTLLPGARVRYLNENARRAKLTVQRTLLWLNLTLTPNGDVGTHATIPGFVDLFIIKHVAGEAEATVAARYQPFAEPEIPSALANWDTNEAPDGLDPFMWVNRCYTRTAQSLGKIESTGAIGFATNYFGELESQTTENGWSAVSRVSNQWHPDVDLRVKRALKNDEELLIGMTFPTAGNTHTICTLAWGVRMLCT